MIQELPLSLTETEKAYIAGIIDGEGYLGFVKSWKKKSGKTWYTPKINISNTNANVIEWLKTKLHELPMFLETKEATETQKPCYHIWISDTGAVHSLLSLILPYMIIKKERAEILLEYTTSRIGISRKSPYTVNPIVVYEMIRGMNKKGPQGGEQP